jgi:light-regulated signal transduction histidine kinase (bacteriophytochrome)
MGVKDVDLHHPEQKAVGFDRMSSWRVHPSGAETRSTAELFGQMFSQLLETRERTDDVVHDARTRKVHDRMATAFSSPEAFVQNIPGFLISVADYIAAAGVGVYHSDEINLSGLTPTWVEFQQLVKFLNKSTPGRVFSINCLGEVFPEALDYPMRAAGVLSIPISRSPRDYLVFFRREVEQTVTWAGAPEMTTTIGAHSVRLTPRTPCAGWRPYTATKGWPTLSADGRRANFEKRRGS